MYKRIIRNLVPPLLLNLRREKLSRRNYPMLDIKTWSEICKIERVGTQELEFMVENYLTSRDYRNTSKYWRYLILKNLKQIQTSGINQYGVDVARNYFTWTNFDDDVICNLFAEDNKPNDIDIFKRHEGFSMSESFRHNILISLLYSYLFRNGLIKEFLKLGDRGYLFGGHPHHKLGGEVLTLDKLSAMLEYQVIRNLITSDSVCVEIGAGSGRTAEAILTLVPGVSYIIADLPPASYIAMERLKRAFPEKRIIYVDTPDKLRDIYTKRSMWDVIFVLPSLLEVLEDKSISIVIAIDCLHEMSNLNRSYFSDIVNHKSSFFYVKINQRTLIPLDNVLLDSDDFEEYYFLKNWKILYSENAIFPSNYRDLLFEI